MNYDRWYALCQVSVSVSGHLVKDAIVLNSEIFETGENTVWVFGPFKIIFRVVMSGSLIATSELPETSALS